jgi:hypothetical protein
MIFIPDDILKKGTTLTNYYSILSELYSTIYNIKNSPLKDDFYNCKMAIHYCQEVYNISFLEGHNDYYGIDIDLSARLMSQAMSNSIVISDAYFQKVKSDIGGFDTGYSKELFDSISNALTKRFKGVPHATYYRILNI